MEKVCIPIVFCSLDQVVNLRVDELENAVFRLLSSVFFEVFEVREDLNNLARVLRAEALDEGLTNLFAKEFVERLG